TAFTWFWRYIWWLWGGILLAAFLGAITGVLGNFIYESITIHKYNPVDPHTWLLLTLSVLTTYPIQTTIGLALFVVFTVSIYIAKEAHFSHDNQACKLRLSSRHDCGLKSSIDSDKKDTVVHWSQR